MTWITAERLRDDLPLCDQWIARMVRDSLDALVAAPAEQLDATTVLNGYQRAGGPQITERPAGGRWQEFEDATGERWSTSGCRPRAGWYDQRNDRVWLDLNTCPGHKWRIRWHELGHSTGAPGRLGRTDFVALQAGIDSWSVAAQLKNAREEITAECGAVLLGQATGTLTQAHVDAAEDELIAQAWTSPVALDPDGLQQLLDASAADAAEAAGYVLEPTREAIADAGRDIEAGA